MAPLQARAGIPVIDVASITQQIQQVMYWQQQIQAMQKQYEQLQQTYQQARQTYNALTGSRGMEQLLPMSDLARNYLPPDYAQLMGTISSSGGSYSGLSSQLQQIMNANAILSKNQIADLSPEMREVVEKGRQSAALLGTMTQRAYSNTSERFSAIQQLINRIAGAPDLKAIADLQARIQAEQNMLTNEQTKLQSLYQIALSEEKAQQQRVRERSVGDIGTVRSLSGVQY
jgi:type IV secretion system protein VirB5